MRRSTIRRVAALQLVLTMLTGCHPTQPFFRADHSDLQHYLDTATRIEYPDVQTASLPEATEAQSPYTVGNDDYSFRDVTLEDCMSIALANTKLVRSLPGSNLQTGDLATAILASPSGQLRSAYDPAITSSTTSPQALVIDQNGNRTLPRGAIRANQVAGVEDALSEFDAQYSSFLSYNTTDRQRNTGPNTFTPTPFAAKDTNYQSAISKRLATGGVATARSSTAYSRNNVDAPSIARRTPSDFTQTMEVQLQHPLARGRGTMLNRLPVVLARINEDISLTQFEEAMRNLSKEVEVAYWDLYCSYWTVETARAGRDSALKVWRVANARLQNNVGESAVEAQALAQVHQFDALLSAALNGVNLPGGDPGVKGRERRLRYLMGLSATDGQLLRPVDKPTIAHTEFDWASIQGETLNRNLDLRSQRWVIKQRELELISAKNQILPDVNISGLYRWVGVGDDWFGNDGGEEFPGINGGDNLTSAWESLLGGRYQEVGMRLELTPNAFGARRALAGIRAARLSMAREHEILREKENAAIYALSNELSLMESHYQQMQFKLNQWMASERETKVYSDKAEIGAQGLEQIVDLLLRAQERRARAQQEYYRAVCEYNKSIVQIHLLKGSLLEYNNIELAEGDWPQKAYSDAQQAALRQAAGIPLGSGASRPSSVSRGTMPTDQFGPVSQNALEGEVIIDQGEWVEGAVVTPEATEAMQGTMDGAVESIELSSPATEAAQPSASDATAPSPPLQIGSAAPWSRSTVVGPGRDNAWSRRAGSASTAIDPPPVLPANALRGGK